MRTFKVVKDNHRGDDMPTCQLRVRCSLFKNGIFFTGISRNLIEYPVMNSFQGSEA
jgi:hypothetical protein